MAVKLSSYRVTAAMDATAYAAGMAQKVAADKAGSASAAQVGAAIKATETKVSQAGDVLTRLSRSYVDGFGQAERFTRAVNTLGRGIETGNVPMARAEVILDGIYRKYGLTANAADLVEQGQYQLATAVTALNAKLAAEDAALDVNSAAHQRNAAAMRMSSTQRTNLMFQLQDIGVSLAGGMNPLMVAMQQGSQISMIYGNGEGGLGRAFSETGKMAGGLVTRLWPVAAVVGVLTAGFSAMTTEINRNQATQVSMGDVLVASWELASERVMEALSPIGAWFAGLWDFIAPYLSSAMNYLIGAFDIAFRNVGTIWSMLPSSLGDVAIQATNGVIQASQEMINGALKLMNDFITEANKLLPEGLKLGTVGEVSFAPLANPFAGADKAMVDEMRQNEAEVRSLSTSGAYVNLIGDRARQVAGRPSDEQLKAGQKEAERQREAYADLTRASQQFISSQNLEVQSLGMTTEAAARLRYEQEMLAQAANDNISLSPTQRSEIEALAGAMAAAEERTRQWTEAYEFGKDATRGFFSDVSSYISENMSQWKTWGDWVNGIFSAVLSAGLNMVQKLADKAMEAAADGVWDMLFSAVSSGLSSGATGGTMGNGLWGSAIFNAKGNVFSSPGLSAYSGQIVDKPTVFPFESGIGLMGEAGPEAILPLSRGSDGKLGVTAANQNAAAPTFNITNNINVASGTSADVAPAIAREVTKELRRQLPDAVQRYQRNDLRRTG